MPSLNEDSLPPSPPATTPHLRPQRTLPALPFPFIDATITQSSSPPIDASSLQLITQGAEGLIFRTSFLTPDRFVALKYRPAKRYRHAILDKRLTKARLLGEARVLVKCKRELRMRSVVDVPGVVGGDWDAGYLMTEWIPGPTIRACLDTYLHTLDQNAAPTASLTTQAPTELASTTATLQRQNQTPRSADEAPEGSSDQLAAQRAQQADELWDLMRRVGRAIGRLHEIGVVHGDLTTSNLMLKQEGGTGSNNTDSTSLSQSQTTTTAAATTNTSSDGETMYSSASSPTNLDGIVTLIDFGLATQSVQEEDRAVDLYVLERAFSATHPAAEPLFKEVLKVYGTSYNGAKGVLRRLDDVRARGRKKSMLG